MKPTQRGLSFEEYVWRLTGGRKHVAFLNGEEISKVCYGASVADILCGKSVIECKSVYPGNGYEFVTTAYKLKKQIQGYKRNISKTVGIKIIFEDFSFSRDEKIRYESQVREIIGVTDGSINVCWLARNAG